MHSAFSHLVELRTRTPNTFAFTVQIIPQHAPTLQHGVHSLSLINHEFGSFEFKLMPVVSQIAYIMYICLLMYSLALFALILINH